MSPNIDSIRVVAVTSHHNFPKLEIGRAPCGKVIRPTFSSIKAFPSPFSVSFVIHINVDVNMNNNGNRLSKAKTDKHRISDTVLSKHLEVYMTGPKLSEHDFTECPVRVLECFRCL